VVDGGWVVVGRFNGEVEVWRGGVFDEEADAIDAFKAHAEESNSTDANEFEFLHAVRVEVDADGVPGLYVPALRESGGDPVPAFYAIANTRDRSDRWSNADGWTDGPGFTVFTAAERSTMNLPLDGMWVPILMPPA